MTMRVWFVALLVPLCLAGCKTELYDRLDESEANQMVALLLLNHIAAEKQITKEGVSLQVDKARFVDAEEILRQNGLPRRKTLDMQDMFPSGQLVSSPEQEAAKLTYLKSQQLEKMLGSLDGVIAVSVSLAQPDASEANLLAQESRDKVSASVFIKYSPETNLPVREAEIRALVMHGVSGLTPDHITITMQRSEFRYSSLRSPATAEPTGAWLSMGLAGVLVIVLASLGGWRRWKRQQQQTN